MFLSDTRARDKAGRMVLSDARDKAVARRLMVLGGPLFRTLSLVSLRGVWKPGRLHLHLR